MTREEIEERRALGPMNMKHGGAHDEVWKSAYRESRGPTYLTDAEYDPDGDGVPGEACVGLGLGLGVNRIRIRMRASPPRRSL